MINNQDEELRYYAKQSPTTEPGDLGYLFEKVSDRPEEISETVYGLVTHRDETEKFYNFALPKEREDEPNTRFVRKILDKLIEIDSSPLTKNRDPKKRFIGTCRDFAILACSIFRSKGAPTRLRCGFADYFVPGWYDDHWVCEYWDNNCGQWKLLDAEIGPVERDYFKIEFDQTNISREKFPVGGRAW